MSFVRVESNPLGPRLHLGPVRWHHYHTGLALIAWGVRWIWRDKADLPWI